MESLVMANWTLPDHLDRLRIHYGRRIQRFVHPDKDDPDCSPQGAEAFCRLRHETLTAERLAAIGLRNRGVIGDEGLHRLEQELDVEAVRLGLGDIRSNETVPSHGAEA